MYDPIYINEEYTELLTTYPEYQEKNPPKDTIYKEEFYDHNTNLITVMLINKIPFLIWYDHIMQQAPEDLIMSRDLSEIFEAGVEAGRYLQSLKSNK